MQKLTAVFFWIYMLALLGVGASGVLIAPWELATLFGVPLDSFSPQARASLLSQYRFLKSTELAFGLFCFFWRGPIHLPGPAHRLFLAGICTGVLARLGSWWVDGYPHPLFLAYAAEELITALLVARQARGAAQPDMAQTRA